MISIEIDLCIGVILVSLPIFHTGKKVKWSLVKKILFMPPTLICIFELISFEDLTFVNETACILDPVAHITL